MVIGALFNHYISHSVLLVELIFVIVGILFFLWGMIEKSKDALPSQKGILTSILTKLFTEKQAEAIIPISGMSLLIIWTILKISFYSQTDLRMEDFAITLLGISLILYQTGLSRYQLERDFIILYLILLTIFFIIILPIFAIIMGNSYRDFMTYSELNIVTNPVIFLARLFGANVSLELHLENTGITNYIDFYFQGHLIRLGIGAGCSGIYTIGLFFSAFMAFIFVAYKKIDRYIGIALIGGLIVTWAANIFRMLIIVLVGASYGFQVLAVVHMYIGIVIFVIFASIFWVLIVRWLDKKEGIRKPEEETKADAS